MLFGMPAYIHSDRGSAFLSQELIQARSQRGAMGAIAPSNSESCTKNFQVNQADV